MSYAGFLLVPLGHGGVIQPACATLGGLLFATLLLRERLALMRAIGALIIVCGLAVIGGEAVARIGAKGVAGDLIFVLTGLMFATFGTLLRYWRIAALPAAAVISVLSLVAVPGYWALGGFDHMIALGWRENLLQAVLQGILAGPRRALPVRPLGRTAGRRARGGVSLAGAAVRAAHRMARAR